MTEGMLFAGIGGFQLFPGREPAWGVEIEPFCQAVLKTQFPGMEVYGDVKGCGAGNLKRVDIITAGVPCQDVSVAGKRAGLAGRRTGLFYEFARILQELRPTWFVFENVPGLLSSNRGRDFAEVLRVLMVECGYGVCWRVLNSQFFGVAQRRNRVFIVGCFGKPCPAEVLFEREGVPGHTAAGCAAGPEVARALAVGSVSSGYRFDPNGEELISVSHPLLSKANCSFDDSLETYVAATLRESDGHHGRSSPRGDGCDNLVATLNSGGNAGGFRAEPGEHIVIQDVRGSTREKTDKGQGIGIREGGPSYILDGTNQHAVCFESRFARCGRRAPEEIVPPLKAQSGQTGKGDSAPLVAFNIIGGGQTSPRHAYETERSGCLQSKGLAATGEEAGTLINQRMAVRRLTPTEAEHLQAFPPGWTIPSHEHWKYTDDPDWPLLPKGLDSSRYRALGNAVTVSVARWIGKRIEAIEGGGKPDQ